VRPVSERSERRILAGISMARLLTSHTG